MEGWDGGRTLPGPVARKANTALAPTQCQGQETSRAEPITDTSGNDSPGPACLYSSLEEPDSSCRVQRLVVGWRLLWLGLSYFSQSLSDLFLLNMR